MKGTVRELLNHHLLSPQNMQVLHCLSLWHQAAIRLEGLDLLGKKTLMSMFTTPVSYSEAWFPQATVQNHKCYVPACLQYMGISNHIISWIFILEQRRIYRLADITTFGMMVVQLILLLQLR